MIAQRGPLREYADRAQIRDTLNRYAHAVDSSDPDAVLQCLTSHAC
jgi:hypothetical protein